MGSSARTPGTHMLASMSSRLPDRSPHTLDEELLLWLGDESPNDRAADTDRIREISAELARGFDALAHVRRAVTVFGSAHTPREHRDYALVREVGNRLGRAGYAVITGGGPGLMEAANRGARDAGALSIGCNIELPHEQQLNPYVSGSRLSRRCETTPSGGGCRAKFSRGGVSDGRWVQRC
jgi:hypothetical protein